MTKEILKIEIIETTGDTMIGIGDMEITMDMIKIRVIETKIKEKEIKAHKVIGIKVMINDNIPTMIHMGIMIIINGLGMVVPLIIEIIIAMMMIHLRMIIGIINKIMMMMEEIIKEVIAEITMMTPLHVEIITAGIGETTSR